MLNPKKQPKSLIFSDVHLTISTLLGEVIHNCPVVIDGSIYHLLKISLHVLSSVVIELIGYSVHTLITRHTAMPAHLVEHIRSTPLAYAVRAMHSSPSNYIYGQYILKYTHSLAHI